MKIRVVFAVAIFLLSSLICRPIWPADSVGQSEAERLKNLEDAVRQLQQRNADLEREVKQLKSRNSPFAPVLSGPDEKATAGNNNKAVFTVPPPLLVDVHPGASELKLTLGGYVQLNFEDGDVSAFEGRFGQTALKDRFRLRRARINLTGDFAENFDFKVEGDFENSDGLSSSRTAFEATDIFINWHQFAEANIKVGQWKAPFGLEQLTPDPYLIIIERSLPTGAVTPERQIGVQLWGQPFASVWPDEKDLLTYYAGIFNGNGRNTTVNDNNNFMYVGRLESTLFKSKVWGQESSLKLGADVLNSRDDAGVNISQSLNLLVNTDGSLSPFVLPGADERTAWSVDAWLKLGPFDLIGEYLEEYVNGRTVNGVPPGFSNFTTNGYYITAAYFLIPKKLQLAVRWEDLNPGQMGNDGIHSITGGLNYYIHGDDLKLMVDYIHTWSDFREANPEFGNDQFDEVIGRVQLMF